MPSIPELLPDTSDLAPAGAELVSDSGARDTPQKVENQPVWLVIKGKLFPKWVFYVDESEPVEKVVVSRIR